MSRSSRSRTVVAPELAVLLERMDENPRESYIFQEVRGVTKYFQGDTSAIADFWFNTDLPYYVETDEIHQAIVRRVLVETGLQDPRARQFLHRVKSPAVLRALGVQRYTRGDNVHYRNLVGDLA